MNDRGFTLVELLIVVVIIGLLAAIAVPKYSNTREKALLASMKTDLRNLVTAEEAYNADSMKYSASTSCTPAPGSVLYCPTTGNALASLTLTADGWTANMTNANTPRTCSIYVGSTSLAPATKEGEVKCK